MSKSKKPRKPPEEERADKRSVIRQTARQAREVLDHHPELSLDGRLSALFEAIEAGLSEATEAPTPDQLAKVLRQLEAFSPFHSTEACYSRARSIARKGLYAAWFVDPCEPWQRLIPPVSGGRARLGDYLLDLWLPDDLPDEKVPLAAACHRTRELLIYVCEGYGLRCEAHELSSLADTLDKGQLPEAAATAAAQPRGPKVQLDADRHRVRVGTQWHDLTEHTTEMLQTLFKANGAWVGGKNIGGRPHKTRQKMPAAVAGIIDTDRAKGYRINPDLLSQ